MAFALLIFEIFFYNLQEGVCIYGIPVYYFLLPLLVYLVVLDVISGRLVLNPFLLFMLYGIIVLKLCSFWWASFAGFNLNYKSLCKSIGYLLTILIVAVLLKSRREHWTFLHSIVISFSICNLVLICAYILYFVFGQEYLLMKIILISKANELKMLDADASNMEMAYIQRGSFGNAVSYGVINVFVFPVVFYLLMDSFQNRQKKKAVLLSICLVLTILGVCCTLSRLSLVLLLIVSAKCMINKKFLMRYKAKFFLLFILLLAVVSVVLQSEYLSSMLSSRFDFLAPGYLSQDQSVSMRRTVFMAAYELFTGNPVFGIGTGNFFTRVGMSAENMYMHMLAEEGLFVTIFFIGAIIILWLKLKQIHRGHKDLFYKIYSTIILVYLLSGCFHPTQFEVLGYLLLGAAFSNFMLLGQNDKTVKYNAISAHDMKDFTPEGGI